jgi:hypothetical protein
MAIDRLLSPGALIAMLRSDQVRKDERPARPGSADDTDTAPRMHGPRRHDPAALRGQLADIVRGVDSGDPESVAAVRPRVIRAVLQWEFGSELREYADWQPMLEQLTAALAVDEQHRRDFLRLIDELQR